MAKSLLGRRIQVISATLGKESKYCPVKSLTDVTKAIVFDFLNYCKIKWLSLT
jgi:hypothetical protein